MLGLLEHPYPWIHVDVMDETKQGFLIKAVTVEGRDDVEVQLGAAGVKDVDCEKPQVLVQLKHDYSKGGGQQTMQSTLPRSRSCKCKSRRLL